MTAIETVAALGDIVAEKARLRREVLARRDALPADYRRAASEAICAQIIALPPFAAAATVAAFYPMATEVNIRPLITAAIAAGKTLALPRVAAARQLSFHRYSGDSDELQQGYAGIFEPSARAPLVAISAFDFILVPAAAADARGARLGYGGGFYDRALAAAAAATACIPLFRCQIVEKVPRENHDICATMTVTE